MMGFKGSDSGNYLIACPCFEVVARNGGDKGQTGGNGGGACGVNPQTAGGACICVSVVMVGGRLVNDGAIALRLCVNGLNVLSLV